VPLRRNRDFNLLWIGQALSTLGYRAAAVAFPLLVLAVTGSPVKAGIAGFAEMLPLPLFVLPVGILVDRVDRRRAMLIADGARALASASLAAALFLGDATYAQMLVVAFVAGTGFVVFWVSENAALRHVVPESQLSTAVSLNQVRQYTANLAGPPLGGALFGVARALPFLADTISYVASLVTLALVRTPLQEPPRPRQHPLRDVREGLSWLWRQPFLRDASLLAAGSEFVLNALYLVVIVAARRGGASSGEIGLMLAFLGAGGVLGALVAPKLADRFSVRAIVVAVQVSTAVFVPLLALSDDSWILGIVLGVTFGVWPVWNASVRAYQIVITPDALQGRIASALLLVFNGPAPLASLLAGFLIEGVGTRRTVFVLSSGLALVAVAAIASPAIRKAPRTTAAAASALR
jgi:MFS family permease